MWISKIIPMHGDGLVCKGRKHDAGVGIGLGPAALHVPLTGSPSLELNLTQCPYSRPAARLPAGVVASAASGLGTLDSPSCAKHQRRPFVVKKKRSTVAFSLNLGGSFQIPEALADGVRCAL